MTGRKSMKVTPKKKTSRPAPPSAQQQQDDTNAPVNIKKEQPPTPLVVKKIIKAENDEARTLKIVFKSNPDSQMKDFIRNAVVKPPQAAAKALPKTPAENHPPAVVQELLETDDDVADNLAKLFRASKSFKNI